MPLLLGNKGIELFVWNLRTQTNNYQPFTIYSKFFKEFVGTLFQLIFALNLFKFFCLPSSEGIQPRSTYYGSFDDTIITIEADKSTFLLVDRVIWTDKNNNKNQSHNMNNESFITENATLKSALPSWSFDSSNQSDGSDYNAFSTKSFKSHFTELRVLAFVLILTAAVSIAIYLLVIECKLCEKRMN